MSIKLNNQTISGLYESQIIPQADTVNLGIIRIATQKEIEDGTDNTTAVTPFYLKQNVAENVKADGITVIKNDDNSLTVIGQKSINNIITIDWIGTKEEYETAWNNKTITSTTVCYITDDEEEASIEGVLFIPHTERVENGIIISWTNNQGYQNPDPVLIPFVENNVPLGGTTGQILAKKSDSDYILEWIDNNYSLSKNKPQINNIELTGNKTLEELNIQVKGDYATNQQLNAGLDTKANISDLSDVATSGNYNDLTDKPDLFSGNYEDLTNKPELFSGDYNDLENKPDLFSGNYNDLSNKPFIPSNTSDLVNDSGFINSIPDEYVTEDELVQIDFVNASDIVQFKNDDNLKTSDKTIVGGINELVDNSANIDLSNISQDGINRIKELSEGGGGGTAIADVDGVTIHNNPENKLEVIGEKTKSDTIKYTWIGTKEEYENGVTSGVITPETECIITDDSEDIFINVDTYTKDQVDELLKNKGLSMFDIVAKDHILTFEESQGLALQGTYVYKEAVAGSRYGYPDFYNTCLNEFETATLSGDILNVNIVGILTNNNGVASGFNTGNYVTLPKAFNPQSATWELVLKYKCVHDTTIVQDIFNSMNGSADMGIHLQQDSSTHKLRLYLCSNGSTWDIAQAMLGTTTLTNNTTYYIKFVFDGSSYKIYLSTTGEFNGEEILDLQINNSATLYLGMNTTYIGTNGNASWRNQFIRGSIDFKESYIKINGEYFWQGCSTYQNANGHKFYNIANKQIIDEWYATYGIADFYGVDTENERIFLPRNKHFMQLTDDTSKVNEMVEAGLPNITSGSGIAGLYAGNDGPGGAFNAKTQTNMGVSSTSNIATLTFDASRSSAIYGKSDTVQPQASLKLLYYCVGNTSSLSAITDVTQITTSENDTLPLFHNFYSQEDMTSTGAYVNASLGSWLSGNVYETAYNELVNKIGTDNIKAVTDTYTDYDFVVNQDDMTFRLPLLNGSEDLQSDRYVDLTLNASGSTYTAPANGWVLIQKVANANQQLTLVGGGNLISNQVAISNGQWLQVWVPVQKGQIYYADFSATGETRIFRFIYAKGDGNLYYKVANAVTNLELLNTGEVLNAVNSLIPDNSSLITSFPMPSNKYIDITLGASNTTYTAPANGWFVLGANATDGYITLYANNIENVDQHSGGLASFMPVKKNDVCSVTYGGNITNFRYFRFIYAQGEI